MVFAALSFGTSVLPVYRSLCPHSSFKQIEHLHPKKARQIFKLILNTCLIKKEMSRLVPFCSSLFFL